MNDSVKRMHVKDFLENRSTWKWFVSKEETEPEHAMLKDSEIVCVLRRSTLDGEKEQIPCESISPVVSSMMYGHR